MEVTPIIGIDPHSVYYFGYPLLQPSPYLTTKVNSFDDLTNKNSFILHRLRNYSQATSLDINKPDLRLAKSVEDGVLKTHDTGAL